MLEFGRQRLAPEDHQFAGLFGPPSSSAALARRETATRDVGFSQGYPKFPAALARVLGAFYRQRALRSQTWRIPRPGRHDRGLSRWHAFRAGENEVAWAAEPTLMRAARAVNPGLLS
jgi:hypothetical protein